MQVSIRKARSLAAVLLLAHIILFSRSCESAVPRRPTVSSTHHLPTCSDQLHAGFGSSTLVLLRSGSAQVLCVAHLRARPPLHFKAHIQSLIPSRKPNSARSIEYDGSNFSLPFTPDPVAQRLPPLHNSGRRAENQTRANGSSHSLRSLVQLRTTKIIQNLFHGDMASLRGPPHANCATKQNEERSRTLPCQSTEPVRRQGGRDLRT